MPQSFYQSFGIIIIIILLFWEFFTPALADGFLLEFEWQSFESPELCSVLMRPFGWSPLVLLFPSPPVPLPILCASITTDVTVTLMFHSFFSSQAKSWYLSFFSHFFTFTLWSTGTAKSTIWQVLFFKYFCWLSLGLVVRPILGDPFVS